MEWIAGLIGALTGAAGTGVPLYLMYRRGMARVRQMELELRRLELEYSKSASEIRQEERASLEEAWERNFKRETDRANRIGSELEREVEHRRKLEAKIDALKAENWKCHEDYMELKAKDNEWEAKQRLMQHQIDQLQRAIVTPQVTLVARVWADLNGIIVDADEWVGDILGWMRTDLIGRNVEMFVPLELQPRHRAGLERVRLSGSPRPKDTGIYTTALTRDGERIPVVVTLDMQERDGKKVLVAQIVHRKILETVDSGSGLHVALPADSQSGEWKTMPKPPNAGNKS